MQAPTYIAKPENRQDFETLCKKLWWELWDDPETKKHGRSWQNQCGVDVYGIPTWKDWYYGIQCKWKDDYTDKQLTKKEINAEIEKAKKFIPSLKMLYFATTANKDVAIEQYIREKNLEHNNQWLFWIAIYSREDIVDLINENKYTFDWYVKSINFKNQYSISVQFEEWTSTISKEVDILHTLKKYIYKPKTDHEKLMATIASIARHPFSWEDKWENFSLFTFKIKLTNTWTMPLENYKISLSFEWDIESISDDIPWILNPNIYIDCIIYENNTWKLWEPESKALASKNSHTFRKILLIPKETCKKIKVKRDFFSNHYHEEWELLIDVEINTIEHEEIIYVDDINEEREEQVYENFYWDEELQKKYKNIDNSETHIPDVE